MQAFRGVALCLVLIMIVRLGFGSPVQHKAVTPIPEPRGGEKPTMHSPPAQVDRVHSFLHPKAFDIHHHEAKEDTSTPRRFKHRNHVRDNFGGESLLEYDVVVKNGLVSLDYLGTDIIWHTCNATHAVFTLRLRSLDQLFNLRNAAVLAAGPSFQCNTTDRAMPSYRNISHADVATTFDTQNSPLHSMTSKSFMKRGFQGLATVRLTLGAELTLMDCFEKASITLNHKPSNPVNVPLTNVTHPAVSESHGARDWAEAPKAQARTRRKTYLEDVVQRQPDCATADNGQCEEERYGYTGRWTCPSGADGKDCQDANMGVYGVTADEECACLSECTYGICTVSEACKSPSLQQDKCGSWLFEGDCDYYYATCHDCNGPCSLNNTCQTANDMTCDEHRYGGFGCANGTDKADCDRYLDHKYGGIRFDDGQVCPCRSMPVHSKKRRGFWCYLDKTTCSPGHAWEYGADVNLDISNACEFASNGECDEFRYGGASCNDGTDTNDCAQYLAGHFGYTMDYEKCATRCEANYFFTNNKTCKVDVESQRVTKPCHTCGDETSEKCSPETNDICEFSFNGVCDQPVNLDDGLGTWLCPPDTDETDCSLVNITGRSHGGCKCLSLCSQNSTCVVNPFTCSSAWQSRKRGYHLDSCTPANPLEVGNDTWSDQVDSDVSEEAELSAFQDFLLYHDEWTREGQSSHAEAEVDVICKDCGIAANLGIDARLETGLSFVPTVKIVLSGELSIKVEVDTIFTGGFTFSKSGKVPGIGQMINGLNRAAAASIGPVAAIIKPHLQLDYELTFDAEATVTFGIGGKFHASVRCGYDGFGDGLVDDAEASATRIGPKLTVDGHAGAAVGLIPKIGVDLLLVASAEFAFVPYVSITADGTLELDGTPDQEVAEVDADIALMAGMKLDVIVSAIGQQLLSIGENGLDVFQAKLWGREFSSGYDRGSDM